MHYFFCWFAHAVTRACEFGRAHTRVGSLTLPAGDWQAGAGVFIFVAWMIVRIYYLVSLVVPIQFYFVIFDVVLIGHVRQSQGCFKFIRGGMRFIPCFIPVRLSSLSFIPVSYPLFWATRVVQNVECNIPLVC